jgi:hypothetical protein
MKTATINHDTIVNHSCFLFSGFQSNNVVQIHIGQCDSIITLMLILDCRYWVASKLPLHSSSIDWKRYTGLKIRHILEENTVKIKS